MNVNQTFNSEKVRNVDIKNRDDEREEEKIFNIKFLIGSNWLFKTQIPVLFNLRVLDHFFK